MNCTDVRCDAVRNVPVLLIVPARYEVGIKYAETQRPANYRHLSHLRAIQTNLVERRIINRDVYRNNGHQQTRFNLGTATAAD